MKQQQELQIKDSVHTHKSFADFVSNLEDIFSPGDQSHNMYNCEVWPTIFTKQNLKPAHSVCHIPAAVVTNGIQIRNLNDGNKLNRKRFMQNVLRVQLYRL